jgi:glycerol-3-phosphate dehydrogenase
VQGAPKLRPLRGSHLIFSSEKLPIDAAITLLHPRDNRALFAIPWESRTMIGTTDLDQHQVNLESQITPSEVDYLLEATRYAFPQQPVTEEDIITTFSGLRPVINTNAPTPSKESRAHEIWEEDGLVTISGGKLTIFRVMAADVLNFCGKWLPNTPKFDHRAPCFIHPKPHATKADNATIWNRMAGRLGLDVNQFFAEANPADLTPIASLHPLWAELTWAAKNEAVLHLDDLLLRRVRLGILLPDGGLNEIEKIRNLVQNELGWTHEKWFKEVERYKDIWNRNYYLP